MRIFLEERDNLHIRRYLESQSNCELIDIGEYDLDNLVAKLLNHKIDVIIQIAPQWQWGKFVEDISIKLMDIGIKVLAGEGAMFRWLGDTNECGADIGFYLSPWGYSGNSKLSIQQPKYNTKDISLAKKIINSTKKWNKTNNNGKILVAGQLENDRSRMYCKNVLNNGDLIQNVLKFYPKEMIVFRKHPLDINSYESLNINMADSTKPILDTMHEYMGFVSINSTSTIEAMCCCIPAHNFEVSPWFSSKSISKGTTIELKSYERNVYEEDIASLLHLHFIYQYNHGNPFHNALNFYSDYRMSSFNFNCNQTSFLPTKWNEKIRLNKY